MPIIMEHFYALTKIPHCSYHTKELRDFLINFAEDRGYETALDKTDNILIHKGSPILSLQAHYDMVCMGKAPIIETYTEDGWLKAKGSSLGADNGMAIAMMMRLMDEGAELEFILTSDEEVGLIGANNIAFDLQSKYMLNLDFEDEAEVCIGCAGGADISATITNDFVIGTGECYEVFVKDLDGGHSGVDIDKNIPSAIKILGKYLHDNNITQISSISGGERRNSIPVNASAIIRNINELYPYKQVQIHKLENKKPKVLSNSADIVNILQTFKHGVHDTNEDLGIPNSSINLAIINSNENGLFTLEASARAMDSEALSGLIHNTVEQLEQFNMLINLQDKYPSWSPEENNFTKLVDNQMREQYGHSKMMAIHAGLECGVLKEKYPNMQFASIGPTIKYPHSTREMVNIESVKNTYKVVKKIISKLNDL